MVKILLCLNKLNFKSKVYEHMHMHKPRFLILAIAWSHKQLPNM